MVAFTFHIALGYTRYGKFTYAIGANIQAARVSGINIGNASGQGLCDRRSARGSCGRHHSGARRSPDSRTGASAYELDAIAAAVIGGTSLIGGVGRVAGTVIGTVILGVMISGFTFLKVDAYYQEIAKGIIIIAAVAIDVYRRRRSRPKR